MKLALSNKILIFLLLGIFLSGLISFKFWTSKIVQNRPLVVVVPHHDLVKDKRTQFLKKLSQQSQPATIILLSPNHFNAGSSDIITTKQEWKVENGKQIIFPDIRLIDDLSDNTLAQIDPVAFNNEHGIKNLLAEIKQNFPDSKIVPIIFKEPAEKERIQKLTDFLVVNCANCGAIASVDMSHYQPAQVAELHDIKTLRALTNLDDNEIWQVEVDSNASLAFLVDWAKAKNLLYFNLFAHTNSGFLADNPDTETTTHIFGNYTKGQPRQFDDAFTFTLAGDTMLGREIGYQFQQNNFKDLFSNLGNRTFWGTDISWINLEGPVSDKDIKQDRRPNNLVFNFSSKAVEALKYLKLTTVELGNNHTFNQGEESLKITRQVLENAGIDWHGDPNLISENSVKRYEQGILKVSLISVNALGQTVGLLDLVRREKQAGRFVIILPHWGNEYQKRHSSKQEEMAKSWFIAGADLIVGSHPHVVQDAQVINGKLVIYSLGNFVFDQSFSKETGQGLILAGLINKDKLKIVLVPIESKNLKPEILRGESKKEIINQICKDVTNYCKNDVIELKVYSPR